jgi:outer membrane protein TolC
MKFPFAKRFFSVCAVALAAAGSANAEEASVRRITLAESVDIALRQNPDIKSANHEVDAADAAHSSALGNYGPRLKVDASIQRWDQPLTIDFMGGLVPLIDVRTNQWLAAQQPVGSPPPTTPGPLPPQIQAAMQPLEARSQVTWSAGLTLAQPLSSLWTIYEGAKLREIGLDVAQIQRESVRRNTAYQVIEAYYRLLQAMRLEEVNAKSVEQIEAQVKRAESFFRQGTVGKNDVLRAQLGLAAVRQKKIQSTGMITLARGRLAVLLGLPVHTALEPADVPKSAPARSLMTADQAETKAVANRIEIRELNARLRQADENLGLAKSRMLPQVTALANYTHAEGSAFQLKNSWFVGATASWDIWEWGATYYAIPEARARLAQVEAARTKAEDMLKLDARNAYVNVTTSAEALGVAEQAVVQAEENYRIESKRYEASNNTSFDVLDAETQLTNARGQQQAALYDYIIAQSALARAVGRAPGEALAPAR